MYRRFGKRLFDLFFSLLGIIVCLPVFFFVPILIKIDSRGPVFFKQKRMGKGGILFELIKFRTMFSDSAGEKLMFEPGRKSRVTKIGRFLRFSKIDEFPQLINVLKGEMSFVGPRPEVPKYQQFYTGDNSLVLMVRPGITDMASVKYRHEEELLARNPEPEKLYTEVILPDKLRINKDYINNRLGLFDDFVIILRTLLKIK
ncbi:MAG: sugar transferase [Candidatus Omnitrophica bacterium]|nr:sugar transferase [Candidatus Omnitrophota bacterium]